MEAKNRSNAYFVLLILFILAFGFLTAFLNHKFFQADFWENFFIPCSAPLLFVIGFLVGEGRDSEKLHPQKVVPFTVLYVLLMNFNGLLIDWVF